MKRIKTGIKKIEARLLDRNRLHKMEMSAQMSVDFSTFDVEHRLCSAEAGKSAIMNAILDCQDLILGQKFYQVVLSSKSGMWNLETNLDWLQMDGVKRYVVSMPRSNQCSVSKGNWELWLGPSFGGGCRN